MSQKAFFNAPAIERIFADCVATGIRKSHDYGAARDVIADNGIRGIAIRMDDKQARILSLTSPGHEAAVKDENLVDTLRDMINYAAYEHKPSETLNPGTFGRTRIVTRIVTLRKPEAETP